MSRDIWTFARPIRLSPEDLAQIERNPALDVSTEVAAEGIIFGSGFNIHGGWVVYEIKKPRSS